MRELGNGVTDRLVEAARNVAALHVRDGDAQVVGRDAHRKHFAAIADDEQNVWCELGQDVGGLRETHAHGARTIAVRITALLHVDRRRDRKPLLDLTDGPAEPVVQMLIGNDHRELETGMLLNRFHRRRERTKPAALAGKDANATTGQRGTLRPMADRATETIKDFGEQWTKYPDNTGFYASSCMLADILGPLMPLDELKGKRVADIGSGSGRIVRMLLDAGAAYVLAVEPSDAFEVLRRNVTSANVGFLHATGDQLPPTGDLDFVVSIGVLHHIPDPKPVIEAAHRALRPGGRLVLWLYGREGNSAYLALALPLRIVTTRLPHRMLAGVAWSLELALRGYARLARRVRVPLRDYLQLLDALTPEQRRLVIYDQLRPAEAKYYTRGEAERLVVPPFASAHLYHRRGYSWTVVAQKS